MEKPLIVIGTNQEYEFELFQNFISKYEAFIDALGKGFGCMIEEKDVGRLISYLDACDQATHYHDLIAALCKIVDAPTVRTTFNQMFNDEGAESLHCAMRFIAAAVRTAHDLLLGEGRTVH